MAEAKVTIAEQLYQQLLSYLDTDFHDPALKPGLVAMLEAAIVAGYEECVEEAKRWGATYPIYHQPDKDGPRTLHDTPPFWKRLNWLLIKQTVAGRNEKIVPLTTGAT